MREVKATDGSKTVSYRYDASGNRIEKRIRSLSSPVPPTAGGEGRAGQANGMGEVTRYLRDASGNVMAIYQNDVMIEQPLYGSSRLGMYKGGRKEGQRLLGKKNYELTNHLGNVLTVITDNAGMTQTSQYNGMDNNTWATVITTTDYYPFGLPMKDRTFSDDTYRYGFNGKEKDAMGDAVYDYGFRIYDPRIAKFLSVDPLTNKYPELTPYQFASNTPIQAIDLDGLERYDVNGKLRIQPEMIVKKTNSVEVKPRQTFIGPNNNNLSYKQVETMLRRAEYQKNYEKLKGSIPIESLLIGEGITIGLVETAPLFTPMGSISKGVGLFTYLKQGAQIGLLKSTTQVSAQYLLGNGANIDRADVASTFIANTLLRGQAAGFTEELLKANFDYNRNFSTTLDGSKPSVDAIIEFGVGLGLRNLNFLSKPVLGQTTNTVNQVANDVAVSVIKTTTKSAAKKAQSSGSNSTNND